MMTSYASVSADVEKSHTISRRTGVRDFVDKSVGMLEVALLQPDSHWQDLTSRCSSMLRPFQRRSASLLVNHMIAAAIDGRAIGKSTEE